MVAGRVRWQHDPPLRTLTPQVAARARRPHRHLKARLRTDGPPLPHQPNHRATTQAPTVGSIIPAARTKSRHTRHATPQKRLTANRRAQTVVHYTPNTPCHPHPTKVDCTLSNHAGGFATIDPRHAGDTPQRSAYGSNSPQATNENKPHHHNKHTKTCRTRPAPHHLRHRQQPHPLKHPQHRPRRPRNTTRRRNRATTQPRAGGTPRGYSKRGRHQPTPCASALTRP